MVAPIIPTMPAGIPLAALTTIDFQKLRSDDADEKQKLWQAATEAGFFYLNYENMPEFEDLAATVNGIYKLEHELFDLPDEFKMNYDVDKQGTMKLSGYKPIGRNIGGLPGNRDGHESWAVRITLPSPSPQSNPPLRSPKTPSSTSTPPNTHTHLSYPPTSPLVQTFMHHAQTLTKTIYTTLSTQLNLPNPSRLEHSHRPTHPSPCILRLLKVHAQPLSERGIVHTPHTDIGSLTVLFSNEPGLQILSPNPTAAADRVSDWEFVAPPRKLRYC
ncbi:putative 2og-fe oxygenase protein [Pyrenophora tritici-repentis]|uniref:Putative 2og-fe oxygenase protein n=1 Tax=Pyrenophora tritici-repentis TaxID=45151 RepID=A0A317A5N6_9PLEO|nr:putative 2og-fe oxygenase protein [Pyrenophora tritici-repentis]